MRGTVQRATVTGQVEDDVEEDLEAGQHRSLEARLSPGELQ